ncbi:MAG TPA: hypothetical protein VFV38_27365 [Ktedonobacteraceae bacterium]|nr:hypothetical protein [Ktedonobacteraceae bacterium]
MRRTVQLCALMIALGIFTVLGIAQHTNAGLVGPRPTPVANPGTPVIGTPTGPETPTPVANPGTPIP